MCFERGLLICAAWINRDEDYEGPCLFKISKNKMRYVKFNEGEIIAEFDLQFPNRDLLCRFEIISSLIIAKNEIADNNNTYSVLAVDTTYGYFNEEFINKYHVPVFK